MAQLSRKSVHEAFRISLFAKGAFALIEIVGGIITFFVSQQVVSQVATIVTEGEVTTGPDDAVTTALTNLAQDTSGSTQHFIALYLISHGIIKLLLIFGLLKEKLWAYPLSLVVFALFVVYQIHRYFSTYSFLLIVITVFDLIVIALILNEWNAMRRARRAL